MINRPNRRQLQATLRCSPIRMSIAALCLSLLVPAGQATAQSGLPTLRRMQIHDGRAYVLDFDVPDALGRVALLELSWEKDPSRAESKQFYIFGTNLGVVAGVRDSHKRAWTRTNDTLYFVMKMGRGSMRTAGFFRHPFNALSAGPGKCVDFGKLGLREEDTLNIRAIQKTYAPRIPPLNNALVGPERNDDGPIRTLAVNPKVTFDLTASTEGRSFMSRWMGASRGMSFERKLGSVYRITTCRYMVSSWS